MFSPSIVQRYVPGSMLKKFLCDGGIYLRRADAYPDDPTEGDREYYGENEEKIMQEINSLVAEDARLSNEEALKIAEGQMKKEKEFTFVQSWFYDRYQSKDMWEDYAKIKESRDCGLIVANLHCLTRQLVQTLPIGGDFDFVRYVEDKSKERNAFYTKAKRFSKEKEYRISIALNKLVFFNQRIMPEINGLPRVHLGKGMEDLGANYKNGGVADEGSFQYIDEYGFILKIKLSCFVEKIIIPSDSSLKFRNELDQIKANMGYHFPVCLEDIET